MPAPTRIVLRQYFGDDCHGVTALHQPGEMPRRQDIEPLFVLDGTLYISTVEALRREQGFCHARTLGYVTARHKAHEVDDLVDFICIEAIAANLDLILNEEGRTAASGME